MNEEDLKRKPLTGKAAEKYLRKKTLSRIEEIVEKLTFIEEQLEWEKEHKALKLIVFEANYNLIG